MHKSMDIEKSPHIKELAHCNGFFDDFLFVFHKILMLSVINNFS